MSIFILLSTYQYPQIRQISLNDIPPPMKQPPPSMSHPHIYLRPPPAVPPPNTPSPPPTHPSSTLDKNHYVSGSRNGPDPKPRARPPSRLPKRQHGMEVQRQHHELVFQTGYYGVYMDGLDH